MTKKVEFSILYICYIDMVMYKGVIVWAYYLLFFCFVLPFGWE